MVGCVLRDVAWVGFRICDADCGLCAVGNLFCVLIAGGFGFWCFAVLWFCCVMCCWFCEV